MKIAIIGASGFIGAALVRRLASSGSDNVVAISRRRPTDMPVGFVFCPIGDATAADVLRGQLLDVDTVIYAAGNSIPRSFEINPHRAHEAETAALSLVLDALPEGRATRFVFLSSGGTVYGETRNGRHRECDNPLPMGVYGASKLACETLLRKHATRGRVAPIILRLANCYGPGQSQNKGQGVVATFAAALIARMPIEVWGTGHEVRDFIYVDDAIDAIELAMRYNGSEHIFNIGSGVGTTVIDLLDALSAACSPRPEVRYRGNVAGAVQSNVLDVSLAQTALRWSAKTSLACGLSHTMQWIQAQSMLGTAV